MPESLTPRTPDHPQTPPTIQPLSTWVYLRLLSSGFGQSPSGGCAGMSQPGEGWTMKKQLPSGLVGPTPGLCLPPTPMPWAEGSGPDTACGGAWERRRPLPIRAHLYAGLGMVREAKRVHANVCICVVGWAEGSGL